MEQDNSSISIDALPMAPRQPSENENISEEQLSQTNNDAQAPQSDTAEDFEEIPEPHPDWQFNIFLDQIADGITTEEFDKLKHLCRGHGGINDETLKEMKSVRDLFNIMRTRRWLSRENLIYLHAMLYRLGRVDLIKDGVEYSRTVGNVIHFYPASALPENGFKYVKFHVEGRNFRNCTTSYVQSVRNRIAAILFIPAQFVIIAGVEPSSSLLITLMIPEKYVTILEGLLEDHLCTADMKELGIDYVEIDKTYNVEEREAEITENDQQKKFASLYQQLEAKSKQLEDSETERLRLSGQLSDNKSKITELEEKIKKDELVIMTLKSSDVEKLEDKENYASSSQKAMQDFECALKTVSQHDKVDIYTLLSANTIVVANRLTERFGIRQRQFELALNELQSQLLPLKFELEKLRFFAEIDINEMDKMLLESFKKLMQSIAKEVSTIHVEVNEEILQILRKISNSLRPRERETLVKKYTWDSDDDLKRTIDTDRTSLLACILLKEINKTQKLVDVGIFISQRLMDIGRDDLAKKFQDLMRGKPGTDVNPKSRQKTSQKRRSGSLSRTSEREFNRDQPPADHTQLLNKVAEQVQEIHDTIQMNQKAFSQGHGYTKGFGLSYDPPPYSPFPFFQ
ncbi:uncharacterized protein LOC132731441 isoform X2 [Ruditapes philippinarum]|uniref:uncharacterized protein LOC132731441 isoform X2 n=1 Tax=Ruditapes philippinarum TaxID=129788 RepID=UPI00295B021F|nr:uncharacterized protein LOC132731441 isoform X2 [Ruditapes philippinarum]